MKIHPTAIVEDGAQLGAEVEIGAFSIVGNRARIGDGSVLQSHVVSPAEGRLPYFSFKEAGVL